MSDEYQWITQEEFLMEVKNLEYLMQDFCSGSDLYKYEDVWYHYAGRWNCPGKKVY